MKNPTILFAVFVISFSGLRAQDLANAQRLTSDPAREGFPTWSPNADSIIYQFSDRNDTTGQNGLWKISLDATGARQIFRGIAEHPSWSPDGRYVVFDADTGNSIKLIPADGGDATSFLPDSIGIFRGGLPCWSPDAAQIAFMEGATGALCIYDFKAAYFKRIFYKEGMLPLPGGWSNDGNYILVALMDRASRRSTIWKISPDGTEREQIVGHHENFYRHLALSPDGSLLVYAVMTDGFLGLHIMSVEDRISIPFVVKPGVHIEGPTWSPDGKKLAFTESISWNVDIWVMDVDIEQIRKELLNLNR